MASKEVGIALSTPTLASKEVGMLCQLLHWHQKRLVCFANSYTGIKRGWCALPTPTLASKEVGVLCQLLHWHQKRLVCFANSYTGIKRGWCCFVNLSWHQKRLVLLFQLLRTLKVSEGQLLRIVRCLCRLCGSVRTVHRLSLPRLGTTVTCHWAGLRPGQRCPGCAATAAAAGRRQRQCPQLWQWKQCRLW